MAGLERRLQEWQQADLISASQADDILAFETSRSGGWLVAGFVALGVSIIGIGIISLIAANWEELSDTTKLGGDFALLAGLAWLYFHHHETGHPALREGVLLLFVLACLATIGLVGQIYHTGGRWQDALLFWCLITFPAVTLSRQPHLPRAWTTALLTALFFHYLEASSAWWGMFDAGRGERWLTATVTAPLLFLLAATGLARLIPPSNEFLRTLRFWGWVGGLLAVAAADVIVAAEHRHFRPSGLKFDIVSTLLPAWIAGVAILVGLWKEFFLSSSRRRLVTTAILLLYLAMPALAFTGAINHWGASFFTIAIVGLTTVHFGMERRPRVANTLLLLLGLRAFIVYLMAIGGLAATGVGLIVSGLIILAGIRLWYANRHRWQRWMEDLEP